MYASTAGGGAMSLAFKPVTPEKKAAKPLVKLPDIKQPLKKKKAAKTS